MVFMAVIFFMEEIKNSFLTDVFHYHIAPILFKKESTSHKVTSSIFKWPLESTFHANGKSDAYCAPKKIRKISFSVIPHLVSNKQ